MLTTVYHLKHFYRLKQSVETEDIKQVSDMSYSNQSSFPVNRTKIKNNKILQNTQSTRSYKTYSQSEDFVSVGYASLILS